MSKRIANFCVCCGFQDIKKSPAILLPFISQRVFGWAPTEITDEWGLEPYGIKSGFSYSICNTLSCSNCNHIFLDVRFDDEEMTNLYDKYREEEYTALREKYEPGYALRNEKLRSGNNYVFEVEKFIKPYLNSEKSFSILDWGGDTGKNTPFSSECGKLHIYDISNKSVDLEKARVVSKPEMESTHYDIIVCSNVLEHIPYPISLLENITLIMNKGTLLYIELPYENLVYNAEKSDNLSDVYRFKKHWHEHINFFNTASISEMIKSAGLTLVDLKVTRISEEASDHIFQVLCHC